DDRRLDLAELLHLRGAGEFAEAVADCEPGRDLVLKKIATVRQDRGDASADARALDERDVSDAHTADICDRVQGARPQHAGRHANVARARPRLDRLRYLRPCFADYRADRHQACDSGDEQLPQALRGHVFSSTSTGEAREALRTIMCLW